MRSTTNTKHKLIDTTRQMIDNDGIQSVSLREIGNKARLSRSAVYRHFKSKEDLLSAIVLEDFQTLKETINHIIGHTDDPFETVAAIMKGYYTFGIDNPERYRLLFCREFNKKQYPDIHRAAFDIFETVMKCIAKAQAQDRIIGKSASELTAMVYAFVHGLALLNIAGHTESKKGLDNPYVLINSFLGMLKV